MTGAMASGEPENADVPGVRQPFLTDKQNDDKANGTDGTAISRSDNAPDSSGWSPLLILAAVISVVSSALPVGYNIGVINTPAEIIKQFVNGSVQAHYGVEMSDFSLDILWSAIVSIFLIGGITGALSGGILADKYGRKGVTIICNVLGLISAILFILCRYANSVEIMIFSRLLVGFSSGLVTGTVPMYLTEIAPVNLRGAMGVICPLGITTGVVLGQFVGLDWLLGTEETWHFLLGLYAPLILSTIWLLPRLPESPKFLYVIRGEESKALKELVRLRKLPEEELRGEIQALRESTKSEKESGGDWTASRVLKSKELLLPLVLVCAIQAGQQCIGINAVFYYSTTIFKNAGLSDTTAQYANLGAGMVNFLISIVAIPLCNSCGRRLLLLMSFFTSGVFLALLGIVIYVIDAAPWVPYLAIVTLYLFVLFFGLGVAPVPYFIGSELFETGPRPVGMAFGSGANWGGNFLIGMTFPTMLKLLGPSSFFAFAALAFGLTAFLSVYFPETKGTDPADIAKMLKDGFKSKVQKTALVKSSQPSSSTMGEVMDRA